MEVAKLFLGIKPAEIGQLAMLGIIVMQNSMGIKYLKERISLIEKKVFK